MGIWQAVMVFYMQLAMDNGVRMPLLERDWRVALRRELGIAFFCDSTHQTEYTLGSFTKELAAAGLRLGKYEQRWGEIWAVVLPCPA